MTTPTPADERPRRKRVLALTVVASLLAFLAVFAIWANRQALETDTWTETSSELLEDEDIRDAISAFLVDALFANVDVQGELERGLPPDLQGLAGPAAGGIRELAGRLSEQALQRPEVQTLWEEANRNAHALLLEVIQSDAADEGVTLDLGTIVERVGELTGLDLADRIPEDVGELEVLPPDEIDAVREAVDLLQAAALWLTVVALLLFALAVYLARGWRREALRGVGIAFVVVGIAVLIARSLGGDVVVDRLATTASVEPAIESAWSIGTSLLAAQGGAMIFYGILIVLGAWLAAPVGLGRGARRGIAPILERRPVAYAALAVVLILLFAWSPTEGFDRLATSLLLIALFVLGLEVLRGQAVREFPERTWEATWGEWQRRGRALLSRDGREGGTP